MFRFRFRARVGIKFSHKSRAKFCPKARANGRATSTTRVGFRSSV
jgi:hypothetical protein